MIKKINAAILLLTLFFSFAGATRFPAQTGRDSAEIRAKVSEYGVGKKVTVTLRDKSRIKGKIAAIGQDSFEVAGSKSGQVRTIGFEEVSKVKKTSNAKWIIIAAAAAAAVAIIIPLSQRCRNEGANALCL